MQELKDFKLDVSFYPEFLTKGFADSMFDYVDYLLKSNTPANQKGKRHKILYGDKGLIYHVDFSNGSKDYSVKEWSPKLLVLKKMVEDTIGEKMTVCAIQCYPNGSIEIKKHQDKEMKLGTKICGISLGAQRKLELSRFEKTHELQLPHGSLYVLNTPTNNNWMHAIPPQPEIRSTRISLTFRNY